VIIAGIIGLIVSNHSSHSGRSNNATATTAAHQRPSRAHRAPPTTAPPTTVALVTPTSTTNGAATFTLTQPTNFAVIATSDCWIRIQGGAGYGPKIFEGTLHRGDGQQWSITAPAVVRLGNAGGVLMALGGHGLALPQMAAGTPYTLTFNPS
jgi:hypothetical protein